MDYRKPAVFGENWSPSRYKVLTFFDAEKRLVQRPDMQRILEIGCGNGWNMSRFSQYGKRAIGLDVVPDRVRLAAAHGPALIASGLELPFVDGGLDLVYIQHVLHHIGDVRRALREVLRVLRPGGALFLIETVEDNPIIRLGRSVHPKWLGDDITARFTYQELLSEMGHAGFEVTDTGRYNIGFWIWEVAPDHYPVLEKLTPAAAKVEEGLRKLWLDHSAHCFLVATKPETARTE